MRLALVAAALSTVALPVAADAQTVVRRGGPVVGHPGVRPMQPVQQRWGGVVQGRWYGGMHAPGGWRGYRRPVRGWVMPRYWVAPSFYVYDFANYGLSAPQPGYSWYRYYDDAVLVDQGGRVRDSVSGVRWDAPAYDDVDERAYAEAPYGETVDRETADIDDGAPGAPYAPPPPGPQPERRGAVTGAVVGGVAGGVAGNLIAGRGNRTAGTLVGAGLGAVAGAAIGGAEDRRRERRIPVAPDGPPPPPPADYDEGYDGPPPRHFGGPRPYVSHGPGGTVTVTSGGGYYGATTTTVVVQPAVTTTETVTDYDYVSVPRRHVRKIVRRGCKCVRR